MENKKVIIVGTSRNNGNTTKIAAGIANQYAIDVLNLNDYQFSYYDYHHYYQYFLYTLDKFALKDGIS